MTQALGNDSSTQLLQKSWFNSAGIPSLNKQTALDYFSQRSNPFYDRTCNNEVIKMQRADPEQLTKMTGIEYMLLHVQEPILYIIRKQHRQTPERGEFSRAALATLSLRTALQERPEYYYAVCTVVTPLADYYILGGVVYQCPDLWSVINSRMLSALHCVHEAFTEITSYARYDPSKGYSWVFPSNPPSEEVKQPPDGVSEEQRRRVDKLLSDLVQRFPPKAFARKDGGKPDIQVGSEKAGKDEESIKHPESDLNKLPDPKKKKLS